MWFAVSVASYAVAIPYIIRQTQSNRQRVVQRGKQDDKTMKGAIQPTAQPLIVDEDTIPDSLLNTRWKVQPTVPLTWDDLDRNAMDLKNPENMDGDVEYNDSLNVYVIGRKMNGSWISAPIIMTPEEYRKWSEKKVMRDYFREKNADIFQRKGKEKFDFSDMHFDLGPAEKIFGPGGVRIKTQGTAELKLGATIKNIDNPSLPIRNRTGHSPP
jgi:hypothetical protein